MPEQESKFRPPEFLRQEAGSMREKYGPDWTRDVGEPMTLSYLERSFPSVRKVFWAGEIPKNGMRLDESGVDGICVLEGDPQKGPQFLGVQISTSSLHTREGQEEWMAKIRAWRKNPVLRLDREARLIGGREGNLVPIVFVKIDHTDLNNAWEKSPHGDWREKGAVETARKAALNLPNSIEFRSKIIDSIWSSLQTLSADHPELTRHLKPHKDIILKERAQLMKEKEERVSR